MDWKSRIEETVEFVAEGNGASISRESPRVADNYARELPCCRALVNLDGDSKVASALYPLRTDGAFSFFRNAHLRKADIIVRACRSRVGRRKNGVRAIQSNP